MTQEHVDKTESETSPESTHEQAPVETNPTQETSTAAETSSEQAETSSEPAEPEPSEQAESSSEPAEPEPSEQAASTSEQAESSSGPAEPGPSEQAASRSEQSQPEPSEQAESTSEQEETSSGPAESSESTQDLKHAVTSALRDVAASTNEGSANEQAAAAEPAVESEPETKVVADDAAPAETAELAPESVTQHADSTQSAESQQDTASPAKDDAAVESAPQPADPADQAAAPAEAAQVTSADAETEAQPAQATGTTAAPGPGSEDQGEKSFEELLEEYDRQRRYHAGDIVEGTVVSATDDQVLVDIGARVEGAIPASELRDEEGNLNVQFGDKVRTMVLRISKNAQYIPLSVDRARMSHVWDDIEALSEQGGSIEGMVIEKVKGGFIVDIGVRAFLPTSLATLRPQKDYQDLIGLKCPFEITKLQRRRGNIILSRKEILRKEFEENRRRLLETLEEGAVLPGRVKNVTDYGAFIDLGGLDGLLHITDMSWGRVTHPSELVESNQELEVKVLRLDRETEKVSLGLKQITPDPWLSAPETYAAGTVVKGKVLNLTGFGAFVELEPGVEGLVHVSEISWTKKVRNPAQVLNKGEEVTVKVLDLDVENRKVSLSIRQTEDNPWETLAQRFPVGSKVRGIVRNITEFGAFVEIEEGIDGLVHVSDFLWGERNAKPEDFVTKGEETEVVVLAVDTEHHKVSLGFKQLTADPWLDYAKANKSGSMVTAQVAKITDHGLVMQLAEHVEGFIHIKESGLERGKRLTDAFQEGQELQALITRISNRDRKVDLSIRRMMKEQERRAVQEYTQGQNDGGATFGDIMKHLVK